MASGFEPGALLAKVKARAAEALRAGALEPIPVEVELVEERGVRFLVRVARVLARKEGSRPASSARVNPFLPVDPALEVARVSDSHALVLNRYSVVEDHVLLVTRHFEPQESLLTARDFEALWTCMVEYDALGFYNSGRAAGASQPHKHLQIVPLPLGPRGPAVPLEAGGRAVGGAAVPLDPLLEEAPRRAPWARAPALPFLHGIAWLEDLSSPAALAAASLERYRALLSLAGREGGRPRPYNLLVTRRWLLLVPRSRECFGSLSLNALAFAGAFFVRDRVQLAALRASGPLGALEEVGFPADRRVEGPP